VSAASRRVLLIGLGAGSPDHLTLEAVEAVRSAKVFFLLEKSGAGKDALTGLRRTILEKLRPEGGYRLVTAPSPERGVGPGTRTGYAQGVERWRRGRGAAIGALLERELAPGETGAFLVWGDPCLYDGMIQTLHELNDAGAGLEFRVIAGISSIQALTAAHRIPLNRIGETITVTTARLLERTPPETIANHVVMLDGRAAFTALVGRGLRIWWGAYLGTPDALTHAGPLDAMADEIAATIDAARARHGWIMDVYLLRRD
jgi:precorrin-6A synthase